MNTRTIISLLLLLLFLLFIPAYTIKAEETKEFNFDCVPTSEIAVKLAEVIIKGIDQSFDSNLYKVTVIHITGVEIWWVSFSILPINDEYDILGRTGPSIQIRKSDAQVLNIFF